MERQVGVVEIVFAGEIPLQLELVEFSLEAVVVLLAFVEQGGVVAVLEDFMEGQQVLVVLLELLEEGVVVLQPR